jgi:hypothetical protein
VLIGVSRRPEFPKLVSSVPDAEKIVDVKKLVTTIIDIFLFINSLYLMRVMVAANVVGSVIAGLVEVVWYDNPTLVLVAEY